MSQMKTTLIALALIACNSSSAVPSELNVVLPQKMTTTRELHNQATEQSEQTIKSDIKSLDDAHFATAIKAPVVLVEFFANWCGSCQELAPVLDRLQKTHPGIAFYRVDTDLNPVSSEHYQVKMVPTMIIFRGGIKTGTLVGFYDEDVLERFLDHDLL